MGAFRQKRMLESGARAPEFTLADGEGKQKTLHEMAAARPAVVAFFKTTCPVCQLAFPYLDRIHRGQGERRVDIYGVSQDDRESTREFEQEFGVSFPVLYDTADSDYPASNAYGIAHVPSVFLVEPDGRISWTMEGFNKKALEELGARAGVATFRPGEDVPAFKAG